MAKRAYAAFLRGVSPMNCKMAELKRCLEGCGMTDVKTVLASGNAVFTARETTPAALERKLEKAMAADLGREFMTIVRPIDELQALLDADPYRPFKVAANAKRVVTVVRDAPKGKLELPIELDGARILVMKGDEVFTAYTPSPRGPVFMTLIERTFGKDVTTRTWDTVAKVVRAARPA